MISSAQECGGDKRQKQIFSKIVAKFMAQKLKEVIDRHMKGKDKEEKNDSVVIHELNIWDHIFRSLETKANVSSLQQNTSVNLTQMYSNVGNMQWHDTQLRHQMSMISRESSQEYIEFHKVEQE